MWSYFVESKFEYSTRLIQSVIALQSNCILVLIVFVLLLGLYHLSDNLYLYILQIILSKVVSIRFHYLSI
jgi:hypothetical protein